MKNLKYIITMFGAAFLWCGVARGTDIGVYADTVTGKVAMPTALEQRLATMQQAADAHAAGTNNPHNVTAEMLGAATVAELDARLRNYLSLTNENQQVVAGDVLFSGDISAGEISAAEITAISIIGARRIANSTDLMLLRADLSFMELENKFYAQIISEYGIRLVAESIEFIGAVKDVEGNAYLTSATIDDYLPDVPTAVSVLENDLGYATTNYVNGLLGTPGWIARTGLSGAVDFVNAGNAPQAWSGTESIVINSITGLDSPSPVYWTLEGFETITFPTNVYFVGGGMYNTNRVNHYSVWQAGGQIMINYITGTDRQ